MKIKIKANKYQQLNNTDLVIVGLLISIAKSYIDNQNGMFELVINSFSIIKYKSIALFMLSIISLTFWIISLSFVVLSTVADNKKKNRLIYQNKSKIYMLKSIFLLLISYLLSVNISGIISL